MTSPTLGWGGIARLGLVQAAMGAIVVLTTATLNRVMVVELALPALLPGVLVALHYLVQVARPRMGHGSDVGGRSTPWIVGGMGVLALGGVVAAAATVWMATRPLAGALLGALGYGLIGLGASASGTSVLVLLAKRVAAPLRAPAATLVWLMMIVGFAATAGIAGGLLDPYSPERLLAVSASISLIAFGVTLVAVYGLEGRAQGHGPAVGAPARGADFRTALRAVWADARARRFAIFVFTSMLAYSAQELILEPFAGTVLGYTPGQSTRLSGLQHGGVLVGMLLAALAGSRWRGLRMGTLRDWTVGGCIASAIAMAGLVGAGLTGPAWPFKATVWALGVANGAFSIAAIGSMMQLAAEGDAHSEGVRMGLWGAAQAIAFGVGGLVGTGLVDAARLTFQTPGAAYASAFAFEGLMFLLAAGLALGRPARPLASPAPRLRAGSTGLGS